MTPEKVIVAMSGGVDSSLAAALLAENRCEPVGITMRVGGEPTDGKPEHPCCGVDGADMARRVADRLGIPFYFLDYRQAFEREVIQPFCEEYKNGRTPNPCILCNERLKFGSMLKLASALGARWVATGHYARVERDRGAGRWYLKRAADREKDQSYFLFSLRQEQLSRALFPLGSISKQEVRAEAKRRGLPSHDRPESQEICFIPDADVRGFLSERSESLGGGAIMNVAGERIGTHPGIEFFTVGQRRGLGVSAGRPLYVTAIDVKRNAVLVGSDRDTSRRRLVAKGANFIPFDRLTGSMRVTAKVRYRHEEAPASIQMAGDDAVLVEFDTPQRAPAPGQAVVFYDGETVVGGGWIDSTGNDGDGGPLA